MPGKIHGVVEEAKRFDVLAALRGHSKHDEVASLATVASDMKAAQSFQDLNSAARVADGRTLGQCLER
jgi:4-hydroxy-3-methylbut-2-enyl diphosphate reductase IspH